MQNDPVQDKNLGLGGTFGLIQQQELERLRLACNKTRKARRHSTCTLCRNNNHSKLRNRRQPKLKILVLKLLALQLYRKFRGRVAVSVRSSTIVPEESCENTNEVESLVPTKTFERQTNSVRYWRLLDKLKDKRKSCDDFTNEQ